jgi:hypothetical protein
MTRLGLIPQSQKFLPPFVKLHRLTSSQTEQSKRFEEVVVKEESPVVETHIESPASDTPTVEFDSDEELDLELELLVAPIDIPEIFEEVVKKKPKLQLPANLPEKNDYAAVETPKVSILESKPAPPVEVDVAHPLEKWIAPNTLKASFHFIKHDRGYVVPGRKNQINIPFVDLTMDDDENRDNLDALREKLLGFDTVLEFAD